MKKRRKGRQTGEKRIRKGRKRLLQEKKRLIGEKVLSSRVSGE